MESEFVNRKRSDEILDIADDLMEICKQKDICPSKALNAMSVVIAIIASYRIMDLKDFQAILGNMEGLFMEFKKERQKEKK